MNDLAELQRRKAELTTQIEQQRAGLKGTMAEIQKEIEPANLLKKAVGSAFGFPKSRGGEGSPDILERLPESIAFVANLFIKNPKWAFVVKLLAPAVLKFLPKMTTKAKPESGEKQETETGQSVYSRLRRRISALRNRLRKAKKEPENPPREIVEPSEN